MRDRLLTILVIVYIVISFFPDTKNLVYFVSAVTLLLSIILEIIFRKQLKNSKGLLKNLLGGSKSLFSTEPIKKASVGSIILYCVIFLWATTYIIWYTVKT
jgi:hypothetical protein